MPQGKNEGQTLQGPAIFRGECDFHRRISGTLVRYLAPVARPAVGRAPAEVFLYAVSNRSCQGARCGGIAGSVAFAWETSERNAAGNGPFRHSGAARRETVAPC